VTLFDGTGRVYNRGSLQELLSVSLSSAPLTCSTPLHTPSNLDTLSLDTPYFLVGDKVGDIVLGNTNNQSSFFIHANHATSVSSMAFQPSEQLLVSGEWSGFVVSCPLALNFDVLDEGEEEEEENTRSKKKNKKNKKRKMRNDDDDDEETKGERSIFSNDNPEPFTHEWKAHAQAVSAIAFSPQDSHALYTGSLDHSIKIWDLEFEERVPEPVITLNAGHAVTSLSFHASTPQHLLSSHSTGHLRVWDIRSATSTTLRSIQTPTWVSKAQWSPSNPNLVLSADYEGHLRVYDLRFTTSPLLDHGCEGKLFDLSCVSLESGESMEMFVGGSGAELFKVSF
jgi:WD40 repeat protein